MLREESVLSGPVAQTAGTGDAPGNGVVAAAWAPPPAGTAAPVEAAGLADGLVEAVRVIRRVRQFDRRSSPSVMTSTPASCCSLIASSTATASGPGSWEAAARSAVGERSRLPTGLGAGAGIAWAHIDLRAGSLAARRFMGTESSNRIV